MIIDSLTGLERYFSLNPHFEKIFKFLRSQSLQELPEGRYDIDGNNAYMMVQIREGKKVEDTKLEIHDSYIDIQMPLQGVETIGWSDRSHCTELAQPYDASKDIAFFADAAEVFFTLEPMSLAILFPHDAHAPLIGNGTIKKIVVKVAVSVTK